MTAGEQASVATIWTANSSGIHQIFVVIDALNSIKESNETNNTFHADINVEGEANQEEAPAAVKVAEGVYKIGNILIDRNKLEITMPGRVNMQTGLTEYLACGPGGKLHESLLVLDVNPIHMHTALIVLGLEAKGNLRFQGK